MAGSFVWFDLRTTDQERAQRFYEQLLGWEFAAQGGAPTMVHGEDGPWALVADPTGAEVALWQAAA